MRTTNRPTDPRTDYCTRFATAMRSGLRRHREPNIDDVVQSEQVVLLERFDDISRRYQNPEVYASVRVRAAMENHRRTDGKQRGRGSRFVTDDNGYVRHGRIVVSGDAPLADVPDACLFDGIADQHADPAEFVPAQVDDRAMVYAALIGSSATEAEMLFLALGHGFADEALAMRYHVTRETLNRRKNAGLRSVRGRLSADDV